MASGAAGDDDTTTCSGTAGEIEEATGLMPTRGPLVQGVRDKLSTEVPKVAVGGVTGWSGYRSNTSSSCRAGVVTGGAALCKGVEALSLTLEIELLP